MSAAVSIFVAFIATLLLTSENYHGMPLMKAFFCLTIFVYGAMFYRAISKQ